MIEFASIEQMLADTRAAGLPLWDNVRRSDCQRQGIAPEESWRRMSAMLAAMEQADRDYREEDRSRSGLVGGDGGKMARYALEKDALCGPFLSQVMAGALRMGECNACMKRIVAAPTAGACGVLPAVLLPYRRHFGAPESALVEALYVASGFGMVIAARSSISGAEGGCQAEIGSAAAMAAAALVHLQGGAAEQMADACAMAIHTPAGVIIHTGDFKVDYSPIQGEIIDLARFGELGSRGVLALLGESTNAERPGSTTSERKVGETFETLFNRAEKKRIIIATFASNVHRVQQIISAAVRHGRKVAISGRSMVNATATALELGYLDIPDGTLVDIDAIGRYSDEQMVIITTGSQGEPMSALSRMAMSDHRKVSVTPNDFIIISAKPIPGNEKTVSRVINELMKLGAEVIYDNMYEVHVSGHACQDELRLMLGLTRPKFFIPIHGEYKHMKKHADLAVAVGVEPQNIFISDIGKVLETDGVDMKYTGTVPAGRVLVDGLGVGDVGSIVLRDRKHLAQDGLIVVVVTLDAQTGLIMAGPDIISRGFVYVREAEAMMNEARRIARDAVESCGDTGVHEWSNIKQRLKDDLSDYFYGQTKRSPMILPVIQQI